MHGKHSHKKKRSVRQMIHFAVQELQSSPGCAITSAVSRMNASCRLVYVSVELRERKVGDPGLQPTTTVQVGLNREKNTLLSFGNLGHVPAASNNTAIAMR